MSSKPSDFVKETGSTGIKVTDKITTKSSNDILVENKGDVIYSAKPKVVIHYGKEFSKVEVDLRPSKRKFNSEIFNIEGFRVGSRYYKYEFTKNTGVIKDVENDNAKEVARVLVSISNNYSNPTE